MMVTEERVRTAFTAFIADPRYPCLAAKGLAARDQYRLEVFGALGSAPHPSALAAGLRSFVRETEHLEKHSELTAFVAVFPEDPPADETEFDRRLWTELQQLHDCDEQSPGWNRSVSDNPEDPNFAFSFAGSALFVIGLHPASSRLARQFAWPALVFNPHAQFERLRREGLFDHLRDQIRERDVALQGSINPTVANFGEASEARQYSGLDTTDGSWRCPFHPRKS